MTMLEVIPDPDRVVSDLRDLVPVTYASLEVGVTIALGVFEGQKEKPEPFLYADLVRHYARREMVERGRLRVDFEAEELANNGLQISYGNYPRIRLRKAFRKGAPVAGSFAMDDFYAQTLMFEAQAEPNLLMLWDAYLPSFTLAPDLYLACPKRSYAKFPSAAECHWLVKLPNVALMHQPAVRVDDLDHYEDLDIYRPLEDTGEAE